MDVVGKRRWFFFPSVVLVLVALISLVVPPALKPGIDFSGGSTLDVRFIQPVAESEVRAQLAAVGHPDAVVQRTGDRGYFIRLRTLREASPQESGPSERERVEQALQLAPFEARPTFESVSPAVARQTVRGAIIALIVAAVAMLLYIAWAFRRVPHAVRYGVCAIVALLHDVLVVLGFFSILGKLAGLEVNAMFIAGVLTVIGYSINNIVVVFDRVREVQIRNPTLSLDEALNTSLLDSLGRILNTSLTTLFVILALLLFGGATIRELVLVLLVGIVAGMYNAFFIAGQLLVVWEKREFRKVLPPIPFLSRR